ncbi:MAG: hypothetical protein K6T78_12185 [Alicyclobacillus sp.]|nr:hypothetical protein [Alicyclobacillus sp.]
MSQTEAHTRVSDLPFAVDITDLPIVNAYVGEWSLTGEGPAPENWWIVTTDGEGHPMTGHDAPQQLLDRAKERGWNPAYAAPYGRHVVGKLDGVALHDWIRDHRKKHISW